VPFRLQFYFNGHNLLANRLRENGIAFILLDNAFTVSADFSAAQKLFAALLDVRKLPLPGRAAGGRAWWRTLTWRGPTAKCIRTSRKTRMDCGGMTSNPALFEKAMADSHDYDDDIRGLAVEGKGAKEISSDRFSMQTDDYQTLSC
jgi:hypothetical protein